MAFIAAERNPEPMVILPHCIKRNGLSRFGQRRIDLEPGQAGTIWVWKVMCLGRTSGRPFLVFKGLFFSGRQTVSANDYLMAYRSSPGNFAG